MPAPIPDEQQHLDRARLLATAEALFYERGIRAVGMDLIRDRAELPLKRIYRWFPTKEDLVVAVLRERDERWRASLTAYVEAVGDPQERLLAVFDWLAAWFAEPGFRGCAWINAFGELGSASVPVLDEVRRHKRLFREQLSAWATAAGLGSVDPVFLLAEGAMVSAGINGDPEVARQARATVALLLERHRGTSR